MAAVKGKIGRIHNEFGNYTLRVDRKKLDQLRVIAESEHRSVTQKLRLMIDEEIARADEEQAA